MNDEEYLIDLVYNQDNKEYLLSKLARAYESKFVNNKDARDAILNYALSSYSEPDCFPNKTPIEKVSDLILTHSQFINSFLNKLAGNSCLELVIPDLLTYILKKINIIPNDTQEVCYYQLHALLSNNHVLIYYTENNLNYLDLLFNPRLCPDMFNVLSLPKDRFHLLNLSNHFEVFHTKISEILLLFCKCKKTRPKIINYLFSFVNRNKGRKKTIRDSECDFDGVVLNFLGSMLNLCEPFLDVYSNKVSKINIQEPNSNFISQCFNLTSRMIDYGFLTTLHSFTQSQSRNENTENEYLLVGTQSQLLNQSFLSKLKRFVFLQLHIINLHQQVKDDDLIESIWNSVETFIHLKMIDYDLIKYVIQFYILIHDNLSNYHLQCELGRITAACVSTNIVSPNKVIMEKLISLYGNLPNVETFEQFRCRKEISKCLDLFDITNIDKKVLSTFGYALLSELDTLSSKALDSLIEFKIKVDNQDDIDLEEEKSLRVNFDYANEILSLLKKMTQIIPDSFKEECAIQKTASAWSFLIYRLIGPQSLKLKVINPKKYNFYPKEMLLNSLLIFQNLKSEQLLVHIGEIGLLDSCTSIKLIKILRRENLFTNSVIEDFKSSLGSISINHDIDDAPEEFYDAIMGTIMKEPVRLPSGNIVDRTTIQQHLKNDTSDPFTRQEMKEEDLIYEQELKERIKKYIRLK